MRNLCFILLIAVCTNAGVAWQAFGQPAAPPRTKPGTAVGKLKPEDVVRQMAEFYGKLPAFSCRIESVLEVAYKGESGGKEQGDNKERDNKVATKVTARLERPNRLAFLVDAGMMGVTTVSNGKEVTQFFQPVNRYVVKEAPAGFAGMMDIGAPLPITMLGGSDGLIPTANDDFYKKIMSGVTKSLYLGQEKVGEVMCHHCRFIQEDFDWDIWIEVGKQPLVHKVVPDLAKQLAGAGAQFQGANISYNVTFTDWNVAPKFTDADFQFTPPIGAEQVDSMFESQEPPHPLLGQVAPSFQTEDLAGHPIDLQKYLGKNVILLDFWATWCGPCVQAMPEVDAVAKKFADKGLVFYGVNAGEDVATIKDFLEKSKLEVPVAMDTKNEILQSYGVEGIPQTVLIGKDGKVQVVHVGFSGELGKMLTSEIEALLAGKDLAGEALAKAEEARKRRSERKAAPAGDAGKDEAGEPPVDDAAGKLQ